MKLKKLFLFSWIITMPIILIGGYWLFQTYERYLTYIVRYQLPDQNIGLPLIARYEYKSMLHQLNLGVKQIAAKPSKLKSIQLFSQMANLVALEKHMPQSGFEYVKGYMMIDGEVEKVKIKYRGDSPHRWMWKKKSIRIKTSKDTLYENMRAFNLLAPRPTEQINLFLSFRLAEIMGLITPRSDLNRVYLNGEDRGIHVMVEQPGELMLRNLGYMPADLYRGEIELKDGFADGYIDSLFSTVGGWDKMSVNNHYPESHMKPISHLIDLIQNPASEESQRQMSELMDMEAWGRFSIFEMLIQSTHSDDRHNWRIYYDPWRQKLIPVIWDPIGWIDYRQRWNLDKEAASVVAENTHNRLMRALFMNGDFIRARQNYLAEFFRQGKDKQFLEFVAKTTEFMRSEIQSDPLLQPVNPDRVASEMESLNTVIKGLFEKIESHIRSKKSFAWYRQNGNEVLFNLGGRLNIKKLKIEFEKTIPDLKNVKAEYHDRLKKHSVNLTKSTKAVDNILEIAASFSPEYRVSFEQNDYLPAEIARYKIIFDGVSELPKIIGLSVENEFHSIEAKLGKPRSGNFRRLYRPIEAKPNNKPLTWSGEVILSGVTTLTRPLIIEPGSRILFEPNASLILKGKLTAVGTKENPIKFLPASVNQDPWGAIALLGQDTNGSLIQHCVMSDGSGTKMDLFEYSAMLSIHDVNNISVSDCHFSDNKVVDDMIHAVYSNLEFKNNHLVNAFSDAIDIDISTAVLSNNIIQGSGNDGIDLMSSKVTVSNSKIIDNGDKGISVGEGSNLLAINNELFGNEIAVQSKDRSVALLFNQTINENNTAIHAYKKNWQYGDGGYIYLAKSSLNQNRQAASAEKSSAIQIFDSFIDQDIEVSERLMIDQSDQITSEAIASELFSEGNFLAKKFEFELNQFNPAIVDEISPQHRGSISSRVQ